MSVKLNAYSTQVIDAILCVQFLVAWAGEAMAEPSRLDWWRTDLVDEGGGGDLLARLLPQTHQWAAFCAARQAAIQVDREMRLRLSNADSVQTLFFWGFDIDEKLTDRLADHKRSRSSVGESLSFPLDLTAKFSAESFAEAIRIPGQTVEFQVVPDGRELHGALPESLELRAQKLAAALLPLAESYPMPFYRVEG
jgi:hypothetical protein